MKKVLVIEDNRSIRENIIDVLETNNFQVFATADGNEVIKMCKTIAPDVILCDIMMPGLDGYEIKAKLNKNNEDDLIPFIYLSAKSEVRDVRKGMIIGADDYIVKPFDNKELIASINARINKREKITEIIEAAKTRVKNNASESKDRILLTVNNQPKFLILSDIISIKADANYTWINIINEDKFIVRKLLKEWEEFLPYKDFLRIHQSYIVNLNYIEKIEKLTNRSFIIRMKNMKNPLPVSQRYTSIIKSKFTI